MIFFDRSSLIRGVYYSIVKFFFETIARIFGYPNNPGMPITPDRTFFGSAEEEFRANLPVRYNRWPPIQRPQTFFKMLIGEIPKPIALPKQFYENKEEGFYNFYFANFSNVVFLPDFLSKFIQLRIGIYMDSDILEHIREGLFLSLVVFNQMLSIRIALTWFLTINPYSFPWYYFTWCIDWAEELFTGFMPSLLGLNISAPILFILIGIIADTLNNLVFTMPFLPSEGDRAQITVRGKLRHVLIFHYLPTLWYQYPIPNNLRSYWRNERPDIMEYMKHMYNGLDIQFEPNGTKF